MTELTVLNIYIATVRAIRVEWVLCDYHYHPLPHSSVIRLVIWPISSTSLYAACGVSLAIVWPIFGYTSVPGKWTFACVFFVSFLCFVFCVRFLRFCLPFVALAPNPNHNSQHTQTVRCTLRTCHATRNNITSGWKSNIVDTDYTTEV